MAEATATANGVPAPGGVRDTGANFLPGPISPGLTEAATVKRLAGLELALRCYECSRPGRGAAIIVRAGHEWRGVRDWLPAQIAFIQGALRQGLLLTCVILADLRRAADRLCSHRHTQRLGIFRDVIPDIMTMSKPSGRWGTGPGAPRVATGPPPSRDVLAHTDQALHASTPGDHVSKDPLTAGRSGPGPV